MDAVVPVLIRGHRTLDHDLGQFISSCDPELINDVALLALSLSSANDHNISVFDQVACDEF